MLICASAASAADPGFYVGLGLGFPSFDAEDFGTESTGVELEEDRFGYSLFGGYRLARYVAFEVGYRDYGHVSRDQRSSSSSMDTRRLDVGIDCLDASVLGLLSLSTNVDLFARVGAASWNVDAQQDWDGDQSDLSQDGTDVTYGLGMNLLLKKFGARFEGLWLEIPDSGGAFMLAASLTYHF
jgi:hypothetical protein